MLSITLKTVSNLGVGKMGQWVKCLPPQCEDPSLEFQNNLHMHAWQMCAYTPTHSYLQCTVTQFVG